VTEFVSLEVDNGVGTIRLARPPMNALNRQVQEELLQVSTEAATRDDVRAVVVYGGEKTFAAGADVKEMAAMSYSDMAPVARRLSAGLGAISTIPKPTVAAVTGYALGGGCELALAADFRIAADDATLGQPEVLLGIIPGAGGTQRLTRLVGQSRAKELIFTGRPVGQDEAVALGLATRTAAADGAEAEAIDLAGKLAKHPPDGLRRLKRMFADFDGLPERVTQENAILNQWQRRGPGLPAAPPPDG
jgi:enoyl-CoA hydratase